ncbi:MAG: FkbM family methyltransferase [Methylovirgula sp.]
MKWFEPPLPRLPALIEIMNFSRDIGTLISELQPMANKKGLKRFGPIGDGGYLMPDDLEGVKAIVSPGVSTEVGFDYEMANLGIDVYMADASVAGPPIQHERFHFSAKFLDSCNSKTRITLDDYCKSIRDGTGDLVLQMDIEGAEYRVIAATSEDVLSRFRIMIIEFHGVRHLRWPMRVRGMSAVFRKLLRNHRVVHIHPNNAGRLARVGKFEVPDILEFTFYRSDRDVFEHKPLQFPHPLDATNVPDRPPIVLPKCWQPIPDG